MPWGAFVLDSSFEGIRELEMCLLSCGGRRAGKNYYFLGANSRETMKLCYNYVSHFVHHETLFSVAPPFISR